MFDLLFYIKTLSLLAIAAFFIFFLLRHLCFKGKSSIFCYHLILFCILFMAALSGASVQNDGYERLEKFITLEKNGTLQDAKHHLKSHDSMLAIDLQEFQNSNAFRAYLKEMENLVNQYEALCVGWLFVFISDIAMMCVWMIRCVMRKIRNRFYPKPS